MSGCPILLSLLLTVPPAPADDPPPAPVAQRFPIRHAAVAEKAEIRRAAPVQHFEIRLNLPGGSRPVRLEPRQALPQPADADEAPPPALLRGGVINIGELAIASQTFDDWVFHRGTGFFGWLTQPDLKVLLKKEAEEARSRLHLDDAQYHKLLIAGSGDIQRFLDRVEQSRKEFEAVRQDYQAGLTFLHELEPLAAEAKAGPFGPDSLFAKTLATMTAAPIR